MLLRALLLQCSTLDSVLDISLWKSVYNFLSDILTTDRNSNDYISSLFRDGSM